MRKDKSFSELVAEVKSAPETQAKNEAGQVLVAPSGTVYLIVESSIDDDRAEVALSNGATIAIDDCGCAGFCSIDWIPVTSERHRLPLKHKAKKGREPFAYIQEWRSKTGAVLLVFSGPDFKWK